MRMPRFCSIASLTASSIEILRTTSPGSWAAVCAAACTARLRLGAPACPEPDTGCPDADAEIVTRVAVMAAILGENRLVQTHY